MDIELGQPVIAKDGEHIGDVERLIIDPEERVVREFLIKQGTLLSTDRIVDLDQVTNIDGDGIHLAINSDEADSLPPFVEDRYTSPAEHELNELPHAWIGAGGTGGGPLFVGAPLGAGRDEPREGSMFEPASVPSAGPEPESPVDQSSVVVDEGTNVVDRNGESVGSVEEVHYGADNRISGFRVKSGTIFTEELNVPMKWVDSIQPDAVRLSITAEEAQDAGKVDS
jgi:uncharacterized protein YrrD